jgi:outer membrane receptor protein involved in Fe transport
LNEKNKALFKSNNYSETASTENYGFGNSFQIVYDNLKTIAFFGELKANFSKNVEFGINGTFSTFNSDLEQEAWNLPQLKIGSSVDVIITRKWFAGANVFFVGERKDQQQNLILSSIKPTTTLGSYFDANLNVGYKYSNRLTAFLKANNIANQAYQKWLNFPVQQFQLVLGANYKFDF